MSSSTAGSFRSLVSALATAAHRSALRVALSPRLAVSVAGIASVMLAMLGTLTRSARQPGVTDELSYLLAARTFASGRLTNPPHPMWRHFEAEHVLVRPTYQSKYPPGQGLVLAVGEALGGRPIIGVWLSFGMLGAALCWMLQAWVGLRLAFFGTLGYMPWIAASYWSFTYWGGALAAVGGALVYGVLRRLDRDARPALGVWLAVGVLVLANTRMYEGLLIAIPAGVYFLYWLLKRDAARTVARRASVAIPLGLLLVAGAVLMGHYNRAVTGSAFTLPYVQYSRQYDRSPLFLWIEPRDSLERRVVDPKATDDIAWYTSRRTPRKFLTASGRRLAELALFFIPLPLAVALVLRGRLAMRDRWIAGVVGVVCLAMAGMMLSLWFSPHYAAPLTSLALVACLSAVRWLRRVPIEPRGLRRLISPHLLLWGCVALGAAKGLTYLAVRHRTDRTDWAAIRARYEAHLRSAGGRHLVLVRYGRRHNSGAEWISNAPDIDRAAVVWARDLGPGENAALLDYFRDRRVWTVGVDDDRGPFTLSLLREPVDALDRLNTSGASLLPRMPNREASAASHVRLSSAGSRTYGAVVVARNVR